MQGMLEPLDLPRGMQMLAHSTKFVQIISSLIGSNHIHAKRIKSMELIPNLVPWREAHAQFTGCMQFRQTRANSTKCMHAFNRDALGMV